MERLVTVTIAWVTLRIMKFLSAKCEKTWGKKRKIVGHSSHLLNQKNTIWLDWIYMDIYVPKMPSQNKDLPP